LALFSQFASGELTAEQLKKRWAEKTIGTEKKMNQRWSLYQFDKIANDWTPVPGQSYNGYSEDEVKMRVWSKYGREALDTGEYKLVNMSEEQQWEVYDVNTDQTLEIVKGKNKGEVADRVYDKYVDQGIGFNVRPYEDPATMTPRAKLAKRIATKKIDYNYDIVSRTTNKVVDRFYTQTPQEADQVYGSWLKQNNLPNDTEDYGYRASGQAAGVQDVETDVAQNFADPGQTTYQIFRTGFPSTPMRTFQAATHPEAMDELERFRQAHSSTPPHEFSLRNLPPTNENFADGKGPGRPGDSQRHGIPKGATMAQLEKASHSAGRKGQLARWQLNMRRGKKK
jgi:hypothetical protein